MFQILYVMYPPDEEVCENIPIYNSRLERLRAWGDTSFLTPEQTGYLERHIHYEEIRCDRQILEVGD